jgi:hypothetical protein
MNLNTPSIIAAQHLQSSINDRGHAVQGRN